MYFSKLLILFFNLSLLLLFIGCDNSSSEPKPLFEFSDRYSSDYILSDNISAVIISNSLGFINVTGASNLSNISYTVDKTVKVESSELSYSELDKINFEFIQLGDSIFINAVSTKSDSQFHKANIILNIPYSVEVIINTPNQGSYVSYLTSELKVNSEFREATIFNHNGSLMVKSIEGNVNAVLAIPKNGFCDISTESGNVIVKIPKNTSVNMTLRTIDGLVSYNNLNIIVEEESTKGIIGKLNEGESVITIVSKSGDIMLEGF